MDADRRPAAAGDCQLPEGPLPERAASRLGCLAPAPYFGFEIPDSPGNYWYVWFDAPIGYIGSTWEWCKRHGEELDALWRSDRTEIHHFIGYDITRFHTLFWPAMLHSAGFNLPTRVHIHGFLTVDGTKMSKSRGTFIRAATYLAHLEPAYLRYYYASKLTAGVENLDLNLDEFAAKVNADLVGNVVNLASRTAKFAEKSGLAAEYPDDGGLFAQAAADGDVIAEAYESGEYHRAMRLILAAGDRANQFIDRVAPWNIAKVPEKATDLQKACTIGLNLFRQLAVYLAPVLPGLVRQTGELLNRPIERWEESKTPLLGTPVSHFEHMMVRVRREQVEAMIEDSKEKEIAVEESPKPAAQESDAPLVAEPLVAEQITIDEFTKVDLRIARIVAAEDVPEAKKLLKLTLSLGGDVRRTVFAGIKAAYKPEELEPAGGLRGQLGPAADEVRPERRHGSRLRPRRQRDPPPQPRLWRETGRADPLKMSPFAPRKQRHFRGAKGNHTTVIDLPVLTWNGRSIFRTIHDWALGWSWRLRAGDRGRLPSCWRRRAPRGRCWRPWSLIPARP